jgi:hypothetical protein
LLGYPLLVNVDEKDTADLQALSDLLIKMLTEYGADVAVFADEKIYAGK